MQAACTDATSCYTSLGLCHTLLDCIWSTFLFFALLFKVWQRVVARMQAMQLVGM